MEVKGDSLPGAVLASCAPARFRQGMKDPLFWLCLAAGALGLFCPPPFVVPWWWFLSAPVLEELTWRVLLQAEVERMWPGRPGLLSRGNLLASTLFAAVHVWVRPGVWAALTFFPSLLIGIVWSRHRSLPLCVELHLAYNTILYL